MFFCRRKVIIDEIRRLIEGGLPEQEAVEQLEGMRAADNLSLAKLHDRLKENQKARYCAYLIFLVVVVTLRLLWTCSWRCYCMFCGLGLGILNGLLKTSTMKNPSNESCLLNPWVRMAIPY